MLKKILKKQLSLIMAVLMLLSSWVWIAPEMAEAVDQNDGYYLIRVAGYVQDTMDATSSTWTVSLQDGNSVAIRGYELSKLIGTSGNPEALTDEVWVSSFPVSLTFSIVVSCGDRGEGRIEDNTLQLYDFTMDRWIDLHEPQHYSCDKNTTTSFTFNVENGKFPVPAKLGDRTSDATAALTIPAVGSNNQASASVAAAYVYDQYGVKLNEQFVGDYYLADSNENPINSDYVDLELVNNYVTVTVDESFSNIYENCGIAYLMFEADYGYGLSRANKAIKILAAGHNIDFNNSEFYKASDCENAAIFKTTCGTCNYEFFDKYSGNESEYLARGHKEAYDGAVEADCTNSGMTARVYCSVCLKTLSEPKYIAPLGHVKGEEVRENEVVATCTSAGSYDSVKYCNVCSAEMTRKTILVPALGHSLGEGEVVREATCSVPGEMRAYCVRCNEESIIETYRTENKTIELFNSGLEGSSPTYSTPNADDSSLTNGGKDIYASYGSITTVRLGQSFLADETEYKSVKLSVYAYDTDESSGEVDGIYLVDENDASRTRVGQLTGSDSTWKTTTINVDPSYIEAGHSYHFELTEEVSGWVVYVRSVRLELAGLGHDYDEGVITIEPGCTSLGVKTYTCKICGATKESYMLWTGHTYGAAVVTKEATCSETGISSKTCSTCNYVSNTEIAKKAHSWKTFDYEGLSTVFDLKSIKNCEICGNSTYEIFNSGATATSPKYQSTNVDPDSVNNGGYDIYASYSSIPVVQTGLSFVVNEEITNDVVLTIKAYDSDISSGEVDGIYLVNETTGTSTRVGSLGGSDSTWYTTDITISDDLFTVGNKYHIELKEEVSGWVVYVRSVYITTNNAANPFTYVITKQPTCNEEGSATYTYINSGETIVVAIPKLEHTYDEGVVTKESTCSVNGEKLYTCSTCKGTKTEYLALLSHTYDEGVITKEPTCDTFGKLTKTCIDCGATSVSDQSVLGHSFDSPVTDGSIFYEPNSVVCTRCNKKYYEIFNSRATGDYYVYKTTDADGNTTISNRNPQSVSNDGYDIYCRLLGTTQAGIRFSLNNRFKNPVNLEILTYANALFLSNLEITLVDVNTGNAIELFYGKPKTSKWSIITATLLPEYFVEGHSYYIEVRTASFGVAYIRSIHIAEAEIAHNYTEINRYEPTCNGEGVIEYRCADCGKDYRKFIPALDHDYDEGVITKEPTCTEYGTHTATCKRCGNKTNTTVPSTGHDLQPAPDNTLFYFGNPEGLICSKCGLSIHTLFDSGRLPGSSPVAYSNLLGIPTGNYDDTTIDNAGYDLFANTLINSRTRLGLNFTLAYEIPSSVEIYAVVNINDSNSGSATLNLVDETTGSSRSLTEIDSHGASWLEESALIPQSYLTPGHSYHLEIKKNSSGSVSYAAVRNAYLVVVDTEGHKWNTGVITKEATCTEDGVITFSCYDSSCNEVSTKTIPALGHSYDSKVVQEATCTEDGILRTYCIRCNDYSDTTIKAEHEYELTDTLQATCTQEGYMEYTCSKCGDVYRDVITVTHEYIVTANKHATTTEAGYVTYTCANSNCGDTYNETIPALGTEKYILLVRDRIPWTVEADYNVLNLLVSEGYISGWNVTSTSKINELNLSEYAIIYIANDQTTSTYNKLKALNEDFEAYVENGGTLIYGACDGGWASGYLNGALPGGVQPGRNYAMHNYIFDAKHRIVTGELTDLKALSDGLLYGTYCSHTYFDKATLPAGSEVILQDNNANPTLVEYPLGKGHVILSGLTWEFYYVRSFLSASSTTTYSKNAFDDLFIYGLTLGVEEHTEHTFVATQITDAQCTVKGKIDYVCSGCGETQVVELPAIGHSWGEWNDSSDGESHFRTCTNDASHIDLSAHMLDEGMVLVSANCQSEGAMLHNCSVCNAQVEKATEINPAHHPDEKLSVENVSEPTCLDDGYSGDVKCDACGEIVEKGETFEALGHAWSEWRDNGNGIHIRTCANDETHTEGDTHVWDEGVVTKTPTCVQTGEMLYTCTVCNFENTEELSIDSANHSDYATEISDKKDANCDTSGYTGDVVCSECKAVLEVGEIIEPIGHDYSEYISNEDSTHYVKCLRSDCTGIFTEDCTFGSWTLKEASTCEDKGSQERVCELCKYAQVEMIDALGHISDENWTVTKKSNCTVAGTEESKCIRYDGETCSKIFTRELAIDPEEHDWDKGVIDPSSTCKDHGVKTYTCNNNSEHQYSERVELDENNHTGDTYLVDESEANCTEDGYTGDVYCSGCDVLLNKGEVIKAHGHNYVKIDSKCVAPDYGKMGYDYYECTYDARHNYKDDIAPLVKNTYTATFIIKAPFFTEDKVVETVTFEEGDKYVQEPSVEKYNNYTFAWDDYELENKDITIYGRYTEIEINDVTTPESDNKVEYKNGVVNITLEAKASTKNIKILSQKAKPIDVILVLDQSGSMAETLSSNGKTTKREALIDCANNFVNEIYLNALETGAEHRVAVVGFAYSEYNGGNYENTGILATSAGKTINYKKLTDSDYASALLPVVSGNKLNANIIKGINSVVADGATSAHLGLEMANDIFAANSKDGKRERIVLFITDGTPTSWNEETSLVKSTAAKTITEAYDLKNIQNAKIYSIGVHKNADSTAAFTSDTYGVATTGNTFKSYDFNRFLHAVSSNYPEAGSIVVSEMGEGSKNAGYYMSVNDTSKLNDIFTKILLGNVYKVISFDKVTIVDTISKEFTLTLEQEAEMRETLISELGITNEDIYVKRNADGTTTIRISNVRAKKVYNADGSSYYSAKVSFNVSADEDSLGITSAPANTPDAGVEFEGDTITKFDSPTVTLESDRKIVVFTINGVVYRIDEAKLGDDVVAPESDLAQWNIPEGTVVDGNYVTFEANVVDSTEYTVTWLSEGKKETASYVFGSQIQIPEPAEKAGYDFLKWTPEVPATMPDYDIAFTAIYTAKHDHDFVKSYTYGKCTEGMVTVYECACGEISEEIAPEAEHDVKAMVEQTTDGTLIEKVTCQVCGTTNSQKLTYKVTYKEGWKNTVLDLTLYDNDVSVQPNGDIEIKFYIGEDITKKNYTVYRIDESGRKTTYTPRKENGYLIFDADHFSFYVVAELDEETGEIAEEISYGDVYCVSNGHDYKATVTDPTCTTDGYTTYTCSVCNDSYKADEQVSSGHNYKPTVTNPTCTAGGYTTYICTVCNDSYKADEKPASDHNYKATVTNPTCTAGGYTTYKCSACGHSYNGNNTAATGHNYLSVVTNPTCTAGGYTTYTCSVCSHSYTGNKTSSTGHNYEDGVCKNCGETKTNNCSHMCHKNNFIWKFVRFFLKLFKINPVCTCGAAHY